MAIPTLTNIPAAQIWEVLETVLDPETHLSIVAMGLVYDVEIQSQTFTHPARVWLKYTLTTPLCPLAGVIDTKVRTALQKSFPQVTFDATTLVLELVFDPVWTIDRLSAEAKAELGF